MIQAAGEPWLASPCASRPIKSGIAIFPKAGRASLTDTGYTGPTILRMDTDEGITGGLKIGDGEAVASLTRRRLKPLIGEDPLMTERLWTRIWEIDRIEEFLRANP